MNGDWIQQADAIQRSAIEDGSIELLELVRAFPEPMHAFICAPEQLSVRQLVRLYRDQFAEGEGVQLYRVISRRMRDERWMEQRAIFQTRRRRAREDALLDAEAQVWAVMGLDFHVKRVRSLYARWEHLVTYVEAQLESIAGGEGHFTTAVRDAMKELRDIEASMLEVMPNFGIVTRADKLLSDGTKNVERIIKDVGTKMKQLESTFTMNGTDGAVAKIEHQLRVIEGGMVDDPG